MISVLSKARVPVKLWTNIAEVESGALDQLTNVANLPFVFKHVAVMPDVHVGKGATVGSVIATKHAVIPAAVGVDIGCGMAAVLTNLTSHDFKDGDLAKLRAEIERVVPVGHNGNKYPSQRAQTWMKNAEAPTAVTLEGKYLQQLGSLGGGNHFIEVCVDTQDRVWIMLHSGSRNFGKMIAEVHMKKAKEICKQMFVHLTDPDLAYLAEGSREFMDYLRDVNIAQDYAAKNRELMLIEVMRQMGTMWPHMMTEEPINCHHNYISRENHFGENVIVTRKGAIRARQGEMGIIPGSMGAKSFIVRGKGNPESFTSCSHGAGRVLSRTKAKEKYTLEHLIAQTAGVECRKDVDVIDEIPAAYKDIEQVMRNQSDLVEVVAEIKQVLCIKG